MFRKFAALALLLCLTATACACAKKENPASDGTGETYTLKYYEIGNQDTGSRSAVQDAINAYLQPKIGAKLEFVLVSWGDWDAKALTALQAGERIDLFFTADWKGYARSVGQGLFTPLNVDEGEYGNLLENYGQAILSSLNPAFLTGTQVGGVNYAMPTNKELCVPQGYIYNVEAAQEVGMDPAAIKGVADLEPYLHKYKELHPEQYPYLTDKRWSESPWCESFVSGLNFNLLSMPLSPNENGVWDETVQSVWESAADKTYAEIIYRYAQAGYLDPDTALTQYDPLTAFNAGKFLTYTAPLKGEGIKAQEMKNASGNPNLNLGEIYTQPKIITTLHTGGSMIAIPTTSQRADLAMQLINLMHSDSELLDLMLYGVKDSMWRFADDGRVELLDSSWYGAHGGAWTMGNTVIQHVTVDEDPEKNRRLREYSEGAAEHPSLGFRYACPPEMEARMAALNNAADSMNNALTAGAVDPAAALPQYISSLKAAGLDELRADVQRQYDEWKAAKEAGSRK